MSNVNLHYHALVQLYAYFSHEWELFIYIMSYSLPFKILLNGLIHFHNIPCDSPFNSQVSGPNTSLSFSLNIINMSTMAVVRYLIILLVLHLFHPMCPLTVAEAPPPPRDSLPSLAFGGITQAERSFDIVPVSHSPALFHCCVIPWEPFGHHGRYFSLCLR